MNNPMKSPFKEIELHEFKLDSDDIRIPLLPPSETPIYKPVLYKNSKNKS